MNEFEFEFLQRSAANVKKLKVDRQGNQFKQVYLPNQA